MTNATKGKAYIGIAVTIGIIGFIVYALLKTKLASLGAVGPLDRLDAWLSATHTMQTIGGQEKMLSTWASLTFLGTIVFGGCSFLIGIIYIIKSSSKNLDNSENVPLHPPEAGK